MVKPWKKLTMIHLQDVAVVAVDHDHDHHLLGSNAWQLMILWINLFRFSAMPAQSLSTLSHFSSKKLHQKLLKRKKTIKTWMLVVEALALLPIRLYHAKILKSHVEI